MMEFWNGSLPFQAVLSDVGNRSSLGTDQTQPQQLNPREASGGTRSGSFSVCSTRSRARHSAMLALLLHPDTAAERSCQPTELSPCQEPAPKPPGPTLLLLLLTAAAVATVPGTPIHGTACIPSLGNPASHPWHILNPIPGAPIHGTS